MAHGPLSPGCAPEPPRRRLPGAVSARCKPGASPRPSANLAKTDPIDAVMLARLGQVMDPDVTAPRSGAQFRLGTRPGASTASRPRRPSATVRHAGDRRGIQAAGRRYQCPLEAAIRAVIVDDPEHARRDLCARYPAPSRHPRAEMPELHPGASSRLPHGYRSLPRRQ